MRHRKHTSKLNRTSEHRIALMRNLAIALVESERIHTTLPKANAVRPYLEHLVTVAKQDTLAARRHIMAHLVNREAMHKLVSEIAPRVGERPGGYLRIVKDGRRMGDGAPMAYIEFVDAAPVVEGEAPAQKKTLKQRLHERRKEMAKARRA